MTHTGTESDRFRTEQGAVLVLALIFLTAVSLVVLALANFAVQGERTTTNLRTQSATLTDVESSMAVAIQQVRQSYSPSGSSLSYNQAPAAAATCSPSWAESTYSFKVYCVGFSNPGSTLTRVVDFYACAPTVSFATCTGCPLGGQCTLAKGTPPAVNTLALLAEVDYDDVPPGAPTTANCSATCGLTMSIAKWDLRLADRPS